MDLSTIGENIKVYRNKRGLSQADLAKLVGFSERQMGEIETGKSLSILKNLVEISKVLHIPFDVLFKDCDPIFLIYAIDDYLNIINKNIAKSSLSEVIEMIGDLKQ